MPLHHASSGELIDIRPLRENLDSAITKTLYKSNHLEVFRLILQAAKTMPVHDLIGQITIQCLEGSSELEVAGIIRRMREGGLIRGGGRRSRTECGERFLPYSHDALELRIAMNDARLGRGQS